jgi:hypothetical protein
LRYRERHVAEDGQLMIAAAVFLSEIASYEH